MRRLLKPNEIQKVAEYLGFTLREIQSSHWQYKKDGAGKVTIPRYGEIGIPESSLFMPFITLFCSLFSAERIIIHRNGFIVAKY